MRFPPSEKKSARKGKKYLTSGTKFGKIIKLSLRRGRATVP